MIEIFKRLKTEPAIVGGLITFVLSILAVALSWDTEVLALLVSATAGFFSLFTRENTVTVDFLNDLVEDPEVNIGDQIKDGYVDLDVETALAAAAFENIDEDYPDDDYQDQDQDQDLDI